MTTTNLSNAAFNLATITLSRIPRSTATSSPSNRQSRYAAPAGSINSSAAEMAKWITLQLNRGKFPP